MPSRSFQTKIESSQQKQQKNNNKKSFEVDESQSKNHAVVEDKDDFNYADVNNDQDDDPLGWQCPVLIIDYVRIYKKDPYSDYDQLPHCHNHVNDDNNEIDKKSEYDKVRLDKICHMAARPHTNIDSTSFNNNNNLNNQKHHQKDSNNKTITFGTSKITSKIVSNDEILNKKMKKNKFVRIFLEKLKQFRRKNLVEIYY